MVSLGEIDRKAARTHKRKNIITRAIGGDAKVEADRIYLGVGYNVGGGGPAGTGELGEGRDEGGGVGKVVGEDCRGSWMGGGGGQRRK